MTETQYRQLLNNQRRAPVRLLFGSSADGGLLRAASLRLRQRERAQGVLETVLPPVWLGVARVDGLERGILTVGVSDVAVHGEMRRRVPQLKRQLTGRIPGLCRLRVVLAEGAELDST